jgi:hypothetical protein
MVASDIGSSMNQEKDLQMHPWMSRPGFALMSTNASTMATPFT